MPTAPETACPIKTVVVLVQENRSFDHMLGWMKSLNPEINGVDGTQSNPLSTSDPSSHRVRFGDRAAYITLDSGHSIGAIYEQIFGAEFDPSAGNAVKTPLMDGFAQNAEKVKEGLSEDVMNGFLPDAVPVYKDLVAEFAVCDRWFAPVPASTQPNRLFVHSATSQGLTSNDTKRLVEGFPQRTIFEALDAEGWTFGIYYQYPPSTLFYRNLRKLKYIGKFHDFDLDFKRHCKEGKLPNYVVVEQRYFDLKLLPGNDDHPSHDVLEGQKFVKEVYEALRASPQWNEILFVIIYDEHGGFYDHVPTPVNGVPSPDGMVGPPPFNFRFDRLGVRVPAMFISPWIERGTVLHGPSGPSPTSEFEHSSIPATVKKIFNLKDFLTKRDEWAGTFETVLTRQTPRTDCPVKLPEPKKLQLSDIKESAKPRGLEKELVEVGGGDERESAKLSEFQRELVQMAAVLCGDHHKDIYPDKLVENMTVADGARYMKDAFSVFLGHCEERRKNGADESEVMVVGSRAETESEVMVVGSRAETERPQMQKKSSFAHKFFACLACNHS